jgi:hypothetical protein
MPASLKKTSARQAKLSKLAPSFRQGLQTMDNFTLASLGFLALRTRPILI